MNSDERLLQVLNNSRCLSKKQMLDYKKGTLFPEELRAVELHLAECMLCNYAIEGFEQVEDAAAIINNLKMPLLPSISTIEKKQEKHHLDKVERRSNSKVPENTNRKEQPKTLFSDKKEHANDYSIQENNRNRIITGVGVAALLLIGIGLIWHFEQKASFQPTPENSGLLADNVNVMDSGMQTPAKEVAEIPAKKKEVENPISTNSPNMVENDKTNIVHKPIQEHTTLEKGIAVAEAKKEQSSQVKTATENKAKQENPTIASKKVDVIAVNAQDDSETKPKATNSQPTTNALVTHDKPAGKMQGSDYEIGVALFKKKQYASALLYLNTAESNKSDPHHWDAVYYSALCNKSLNKTGKAKRQFKQIIKAGAPQKSAAENQLSELGSGDDE